jgi:hypothetical protein
MTDAKTVDFYEESQYSLLAPAHLVLDIIHIHRSRHIHNHYHNLLLLPHYLPLPQLPLEAVYGVSKP